MEVFLFVQIQSVGFLQIMDMDLVDRVQWKTTKVIKRL